MIPYPTLPAPGGEILPGATIRSEDGTDVTVERMEVSMDGWTAWGWPVPRTEGRRVRVDPDADGLFRRVVLQVDVVLKWGVEHPAVTGEAGAVLARGDKLWFRPYAPGLDMVPWEGDGVVDVEIIDDDGEAQEGDDA